MEMMQKVQKIIQDAIHDAEVHILDPRQDGVHLEAYVISKQFEGLSLVDQHRLVMGPLKKNFQTDLHALGLKTMTPNQWEKSALKEKLS